MSQTACQNGNFTIKRGEALFTESQKVEALSLLLQGRADFYLSPTEGAEFSNGDDIARKCFRLFNIGQNIFIGASSIYNSGKYACSCIATEDCSLFAFPAQSPGQVAALINGQRDYGAYIVTSQCTLISSFHSALVKADELARSLKAVTERLIAYFWYLKEKNGFQHTPSSRFFRDGLELLQNMKDNRLEFSPVFTASFFEAPAPGTQDQSDIQELDNPKINYYKHIANLPAELRRNFFGADTVITCYHIKDASHCLEELVDGIRDLFTEAGGHFKHLYSEDKECIYSEYAAAASEMARTGQDNSEMLRALDYITAKIRNLVEHYRNEYGHRCQTDLEYIEHHAAGIKSSVIGLSSSGNAVNAASGSLSAGEGMESIPEELRDSAKKILEFAQIPEEQTSKFLMNLFAFRNLKDRLSTDNDARNIRNGVTSMYFEIYRAVYKKACETKNTSRLLQMFLSFGYMDEKLLAPAQTTALFRLSGKESSLGRIPVHTMREWLNKISGMEKEPSINEFGQDYQDVFREMRKRGEVSDRDKLQYDADVDGKLAHEVNNLFRLNHKMCHGQINTYFPILHSEMITRDLTKSHVTSEAINDSLNRLLEVDFSAFHREVHYRNPDKGLEKELIMKFIAPDIILMPVFGTRAMMWQEISGRNRSTPGRFTLPVFTDEDLDEMLIRLVGNFRWELCRTMMGSAWNDVTESSLTSEYTDYIQFFKKNKDLSEEAKEKVKAQITKYHNRMRDIFTADYETWILHEARGSIRLNKVARSILYRHCPLSKPLREQMEKQPMYAETALQFRNQRNKQAKDLENHYNRLAKASPLDPELRENLTFYRDL